jgi:hypothetical protein
MRFSILLVLLLLLALPGCNEDTSATKPSKTAEAARIEKEVVRRVEAAKLESTVRTSRLHTVRLIGLATLACGAVGGLVWMRQSRNPAKSPHGALIQRNEPPLRTDHYPPRSGRVIDFPTTPASHRQGQPHNPRNHTP